MSGHRLTDCRPILDQCEIPDEFRDRIHSLLFFLFPGEAHLIVSIWLGFVLLIRLSTPVLASHARRDKRFHPVQQEKQAEVTPRTKEPTRRGNPLCEQHEKQLEVTLKPEESVGGA